MNRSDISAIITHARLVEIRGGASLHKNLFFLPSNDATPQSCWLQKEQVALHTSPFSPNMHTTNIAQRCSVLCSSISTLSSHTCDVSSTHQIQMHLLLHVYPRNNATYPKKSKYDMNTTWVFLTVFHTKGEGGAHWDLLSSLPFRI